MKAGVFSLVLMLTAAVSAAEMPRFNPKAVSPRQIKWDNKIKFQLAADGRAMCEVVTSRNRSTAFAAEELAAFLSRATGAKIPLVKKPSGRVTAFILGAEGAAKLKFDLKKLDRDGYIIKSSGKNIIIAGTDNPRGNPRVRCEFSERGTLNGVYEFLERFCGVRFYFPGDIGTIVPRNRNLTVPGIDIIDRPDNQHRQSYCVGIKTLGNGKLNYYDDAIAPSVQRLAKLRMRESTLNLPNCHGLAELGLVQRFAKSNPEFFALKENGKRHDGSVVTRASDEPGQLCLSSEGLKEEIFQDAKAFLSGKSAKERGVLMPNGKYFWMKSRHSLPFFNIMPNDSHYPCRCSKCKGAYDSGNQSASNLIWKFKTDIARRLQKEGVAGYCTMMAYANYRDIPECDIPSNVIVMLALTGPWNELNPNQAKHYQLLADWNKKLNAKSYLWTYTTKCGNLIADIPGFTPKAVGSFFKKVKDSSFGAFLESETDFWIFNFMNFYIFGKVMWDSNTDVDAVIAEHLKLMYGAAAPQMKDFYDTLERHWLKDIMSNIRETDVGPQAVLPSQFDIWTRIYGSAEIGRVNKLFDSAEKAVAADKEALKRVRFMRAEMWGRVLDGAKRFNKHNNDNKLWTIYVQPAGEKITVDGKLDEKIWQKSAPVWMLPRGKESCEVHTRVRMLADKDNFYVGIECDEPHTDKMLCAKRQTDEVAMWQDNLVELFFSGKAADDFLYQIMLTSDGMTCDMRNSPGQMNTKWNSKLEFKPGVVPGKMWVAEVKIPRRSMPELKGNTFMVNFTRGRKLDPAVKVNIPYYTWNKFQKQRAENCGTAIIGTKPESASVVKLGDFDRKVGNRRFMQSGKYFWWVGKKMVVDRNIFRTNGQSVCLVPEVANVLRQYISKDDLKPSTRYKLSFFVKLKDVTGGKVAPRAGFTVDVRFGCDGKYFVYYPFKQALMGNIDWTRFEFEFKTPPVVGNKNRPYIGFYLNPKASGKVWLDHVEMVEVK